MIIATLLCFSGPPLVQAGALAEGRDAYEGGDYQAALKRFIDAQLADPERAELLYNIGNSYYKTGDFDAAQGYYRQALEHAGEDERLKAKAHYNLGNSSYRLGKADEALGHYEEALKFDPDDQQARENHDHRKGHQRGKHKRKRAPAIELEGCPSTLSRVKS